MVVKKVMINGKGRCAYAFFLATFIVFWMLYLQAPPKPNLTTILAKTEYTVNVDLKHLLTNLTVFAKDSENVETQYVVNSSMCKIRNLNPYNSEILPYFHPKKYRKCRDKPLLTYISKKDNIATLHIDQKVAPQYSKTGVRCCWSAITPKRDLSESDFPDFNYDITSCQQFDDKVTLKEEVAYVKCTDRYHNQVYKNTHAVVTVRKDVQQKIDDFTKSERTNLSVMLVGIDSISRSNFARSVPYTHLYLKEHDWVEFKGYNKIGDNTFPNLMGILTGMNETTAFKDCNPRILGPLDKCDIVWYHYRNNGFITAYAEDEKEINTFNYLKKGFKRQPTDYYYRWYVYSTESLLDNVEMDSLNYCTGPENAGERILNIARDFTSTFRNYSTFSFFWMNSYSHNDITGISRMDEKLTQFFEDMEHTGVLNNTIVIFLSDHGFRFGKITYTQIGWFEERLPFFYMSIPKWFQKKYPEKYNNLHVNTERLTSPYDLFMTLQDILIISGANYTSKPSSACPKCRSLFQEAETERSCQDAGIEKHWCTCSTYLTIPINSLLVIEAAKFLISEIHKVQVNTGADIENCMEFKLNTIMSAGIAEETDNSHKNTTYLLIILQVIPDAVFEGTVSINVDSQTPAFKLEGSITRLDYYSEKSWCVSDSILKKYCYCQTRIKYFWSSVSSVIRRIGDTFNVFK